MKILNLYAGIGGNRTLWGEEHTVTAVENDLEIAAVYASRFIHDTIETCDAQEYLLEHFHEFDFIWASPPCQTHSRARYWASGGGNPKFLTYKPVYPDMKLYELILFLKYYFKGAWVVENVVSFYEPLIKPIKVGKHYFWSNFPISHIEIKSEHFGNNEALAISKGIDVSRLKGISKRKDQVLRNTMKAEIGLHVFRCAFKERQNELGDNIGK